MTKSECLYRVLESVEENYANILHDVEEAIIREGTIDEVRNIVRKGRMRIELALANYNDLESKLRARTEGSFNRENLARQLEEGKISEKTHANAMKVMDELDGKEEK